MTKRFAVLLAGLTLLLSAHTQAQALSEQSVSRFIASMEELQGNDSFSADLMAAWEAARAREDSPGSIMVSDVVAFLEGREGYSTLETVTERYGFEGPRAWGRTGDHALLALARLDMADNIEGLQQRLHRMREDVDQNEHFSQEQKQRMGAMIDNTLNMLNRMENVPMSALEAVRPYRVELKRVLEYDRGA